MENKNSIVLFSGIFLVLGLLLGATLWGRPTTMNSATNHFMPDGSMMGGSDMTSMMVNMNASLQGKTGDAFDQAFIAEMVVHHQGAIDMAKLATSSAKHQEIKDLATAIITAQTTEITQMKSWYKNWFGKELPMASDSE